MPAFLLNPAVRYLSIAIAVIAIVGGTYLKGRSDGHNLVAHQLAEQKIEWMTKVTHLQLAHQREADQAAAKYLKASSDLKGQITKLKDNPRIITKYIPAKVDKPVPNGLVTLHDRSAEGKDLDDEVFAPGSPSDIILSVYGVTVAENYALCAADRVKLISLQSVVQDYMMKQKDLTK